MSSRNKITKQGLDQLRKTPTASLSDALDRLGINGFMDHEVKPAIMGKKIVGPAVTVQSFVTSERKEPPTKALEAIDTADPGSVIVIGCEGDGRNIAFYGGLMATASKVKGLEAAVLDGGVRDVSEVRELGFQIFARSMVPSTSVGRAIVIGANAPVTCGGVVVKPGDIVVGDDDGVVVIPSEHIAEVLAISAEIDELERKETEELKRGTSLIGAIKKFARI